MEMAYSGRIASNASFLMEYMLMLAMSPTLAVGELPIKMWGRYLPDVYSLAVWKLFGITQGREQIDHLIPWEMPDLRLFQEPGQAECLPEGSGMALPNGRQILDGQPAQLHGHFFPNL